MTEVCTYQFWIREAENTVTECDSIWIRGNDGSPISIDKAWIRTSNGSAMQIFPWCEEDEPPCQDIICPDAGGFETWNNAIINPPNDNTGGGVQTP